EVVAEILLGPSLLGWLSQSLTGVDLSARLVPPAAPPHLRPIAAAGHVLHMVLDGLEDHQAVLRSHGDACITVAHASMAVPFGLIAQLGVVLYMFLVGLEMNPAVLRSQGHACLTIAHASMAVPFVLGLWLAPALHPDLAPEGVPFFSFALFVGVALSITAFPVL